MKNIKRELYLNRIEPFIDKPIIKVITGIRRSGKSYFFKQIISLLKSRQIPNNNILYIDKENIKYDFIKNYLDLNKFIKQSCSGIKGKKYLFIDEIQEIESWEKVIVSIFSEQNIDIYLSGSNAHLLSSEISTLLAGRFIEIPIYTLTFKEFLNFRTNKKDIKSEFKLFMKYGGFPVIHHFELNDDMVYQYINAIYNTILLKDVIERNNIRNVSLLKNIFKYVLDNTGNIFSANKISDFLKSQKLKISPLTVHEYLHYLSSVYAIHKTMRFDIKGKRILELYEKYFIGDIGFINSNITNSDNRISGILENIVYLNLKANGYNVYIGKLNGFEVDFIAEKHNKRIYFQVSYILNSKKTIERELNPLLQINDNFPKYLLSMDEFGNNYKGIEWVNIIDWLIEH